MKTRWPLIAVIFLLASCSGPGTSEVPVPPTDPPPAAPTQTEVAWTETPTLPPTEAPTDIPLPTNTALPAPTSTQAPQPTAPQTFQPGEAAIIARLERGPNAFYLVGGSQNGSWIGAGDQAESISIHDEYQIQTAFESQGWFTGEGFHQDPLCLTYYVDLEAVPITESVVGISADWQIQPRTPLEVSVDQVVYKQALAAWLVAQAPSQPIVAINKIWRVDLEGNGSEEVLLNATHFAESTGHHVEARDYSVIFLRTVIGNEVVTKTIIGDFYAEAMEFRYPLTYILEFVGDLNGDGKMEVVVGVSGWERSGVMIYEIDLDQVKLVLNVLCKL